MVGRKLYKTKLCVLYQRGRCNRQTCSFAHGDAELRRFSGSFTGRRDYRGSDLRNKLDSRHSPLRRYSPLREARGRDASHGYSPTRTLEKRRKGKKKQELDGQSDFSGSLKNSDGTEEYKYKKLTSSDATHILDQQLGRVQSEIDLLDDDKHQLEIYLEESVQEADSLNSRIQELEMQLCDEKEECKRITSKIKMFIRTHNCHVRIQDELKRSQAQLQKLSDQFSSDLGKPGANEEDSNINILSDGETTGTHEMSPRNELLKNASPTKKRQRIHLEADKESKQVNSRKGGLPMGTQRLDMHSPWNEPHVQFNNSKEDEVDYHGTTGYGRLPNEDKHEWAKNISTKISSAIKLKASESGFVLPSTSMAAHAVDDIVEVVEVDEKLEAVEIGSKRFEKGGAYEIPRLPILLPPPLPPVRLNGYSQYKGDDEKVDVEGAGEEMGNVVVV